MSPDAAVKEHLTARPQPGHDVLEIRHGRRGTTNHGGVKGTAPRGEQAERDETTADLEAPVGNVLVWHPVAGHVERRPEQEGERPRTKQRAGRATDRNVQRHDHRPDDRLCSRAMGFLDRLRNWLSGPTHVDAGDAEGAADLHQEYGTPDKAQEDVERMEYYAGGGPVPGLAGEDSAEVAEGEIESEEAPPGP